MSVRPALRIQKINIFDGYTYTFEKLASSLGKPDHATPVYSTEDPKEDKFWNDPSSSFRRRQWKRQRPAYLLSKQFEYNHVRSFFVLFLKRALSSTARS